MKQLRITNSFAKMADAKLSARGREIQEGIESHPEYFPTPSPTKAVYQTSFDNFNEAAAKAVNGSSYEKAIRDQKKDGFVEVLHSLANYVLFTANGDVAIAEASKFSIAKEPKPAPELTPAANQMVENGPNSGEVKFSFDKVPGARSYVYQCTEHPLTEGSVWTNEVGTISKKLFSGLISAKKYWFRVMAIGINGQGVYSEPVSRISQ